MDEERLKNYRAIVAEREQIKLQLEQLETAMYAPKIQRLTGMPSAAPVDNPLDERVDRRAALIAFYTAKDKELAAELLAIEKAIEGLTPAARVALRYHYIEGIKWERVCVLMSYSWRSVMRIRRYALEQLAKEG